jgi:hypothetical protein
MVDDLVRRRVAVLAPNTPAAHAAKRAAGTIPVVFFTGEDPVASGLVASLNRPGGNVTGVTSLFGGLAAKQVGLLSDLVPAATLIGFLVNPRNPITERNVQDAFDAAQKLGKKIEIVHASSEAEIDTAFDTLRGIRASALLDAWASGRGLLIAQQSCTRLWISAPDPPLSRTGRDLATTCSAVGHDHRNQRSGLPLGSVGSGEE